MVVRIESHQQESGWTVAHLYVDNLKLGLVLGECEEILTLAGLLVMGGRKGGIEVIIEHTIYGGDMEEPNVGVVLRPPDDSPGDSSSSRCATICGSGPLGRRDTDNA